LQVLEHHRQDREGSPNRQWPWPSETEQQREKEIADEVIELKAKSRARCPFRRAEGEQRTKAAKLQTFNVGLMVIVPGPIIGAGSIYVRSPTARRASAEAIDFNNERRSLQDNQQSTKK
jgi:hypothetical protein